MKKVGALDKRSHGPYKRCSTFLTSYIPHFCIHIFAPQIPLPCPSFILYLCPTHLDMPTLNPFQNDSNPEEPKENPIHALIQDITSQVKPERREANHELITNLAKAAIRGNGVDDKQYVVRTIHETSNPEYDDLTNCRQRSLYKPWRPYPTDQNYKASAPASS